MSRLPIANPSPMIRPVAISDVDRLARLHLLAFHQEAWGRQEIADLVRMPASAGLVAADIRDADELVGFALYTIVAEDAELLTLAVHPEMRRHGIGRNMVEHFLGAAAAAGAHRALLEVAADNPAAQRLYSRLGFSLSGIRPNYYRRAGNRQISAHLLRRSLFPDLSMVG